MRRGMTTIFRQSITPTEDLTSRVHKRNVSNEARKRMSIVNQIKAHEDAKFFKRSMTKMYDEAEQIKKSKTVKFAKSGGKRKSKVAPLKMDEILETDHKRNLSGMKQEN